MIAELDGIECYYPSHTEAVTALCFALCRTHGWMVTCGSDCHGAFESTQVGELPIPLDALDGVAELRNGRGEAK